MAEQTQFRWRKAYGGLNVDPTKRPRELEAENAGLKRAVADFTVENLTLREVAEGKY